MKKQIFTLTNAHLQILNEERELHLNGKSKSYTRSEAIKIIKGKRKL